MFFVFLFFLFCFVFALSRAAPTARGGSQARGRIGSCSHRPTPEPQQRRIQAMSAAYTTAQGNARSFNPLSKARDRTRILMDTSQVHNLLSHNGNFRCIIPMVHTPKAFIAQSLPRTPVAICHLKWSLIFAPEESRAVPGSPPTMSISAPEIRDFLGAEGGPRAPGFSAPHKS